MALREKLAAAEKKLELKWLIEEQLGAALARAETAERELDMANTRLRLLAHIEDNAVELVELRAERARHAEELARVVAISKDLEREARVTGDRIKVLGTRLADSCRLACREVLRKARAERSPQVDEWIASAIHAARSMIEAGKNDDAVAAAEAERDRLREYVGRLEAALVRLHEIYAWGVQQNDDDEHETWWKAALECVALGREIAGREP